MATKTKFRKLVDRVRLKGVKPGERPPTYIEMASRCRISRPFFYVLLAGTQGASLPFKQRIAKGLKLSVNTVARAIGGAR